MFFLARFMKLLLQKSELSLIPPFTFLTTGSYLTPANVDRDTIDEMESEARQIGNESRMKPVNDFICKFIQIFEVYDKKGVDEDAYRTVVDNYLSKLRER